MADAAAADVAVVDVAPPQRVGLLGGGVIGGGWAARFALAGSEVRLYDPDPQIERKVSEVLAGARVAWAALTDVALPPEGAVRVVGSVAEAVDGAQLVQESAPEVPELKQRLLAEADRHAPDDAIVASSTSGLTPTVLQAQMARPERMVVAHPFNPVYLLPLVEVCAGQRTDPTTTARAAATYASVGMRPLVVRREIDGFVADRLLEALWREALWLVADGIATVEEVDDAIRYGAGLRWSFMGTYQTCRIAGGEGGMRHFMAQFGPALQWPWTHLMEVPQLTDELLDRIAEQSDDQIGAVSVRELEAVRDRCLVAVLRALRDVPYGAGEALATYESRLLARP